MTQVKILCTIAVNVFFFDSHFDNINNLKIKLVMGTPDFIFLILLPPSKVGCITICHIITMGVETSFE
jgi:hypothetical protein